MSSWGILNDSVCYSWLSPSGRRRFGSSVLVPQPGVNEGAMSKTSRKPSKRGRRSEQMAEYTFDYSRSRPNRFASRMKENAVAVVLEPDVAEVFGSSDSVNQLLRSVISAMPHRARRRRGGRRKAS